MDDHTSGGTGTATGTGRPERTADLVRVEHGRADEAELAAVTVVLLSLRARRAARLGESGGAGGRARGGAGSRSAHRYRGRPAPFRAPYSWC
ncbi:acyl-CoA carboxylase epsilon subunit [Streptomyces sp. NRRL F-5053]|uniref:acyl-CoA carboxylase epsilon subunit n=1 Tax=Streptomyces sp. NRRL F-5053 TaxID=1463854 RepID=UPI00099E080B|nr:acyl-CoA carboxylase epsilon subunit [Streptomyces sp. NRRL F-5053]